MSRWFRFSRTELLLFLLLWATYAYFYQSTYAGEAARFDQLRAIVHDHTLEINKYWSNTADVIHRPGGGGDNVYPNKAPGLVIASLVPFAVVSLLLAIPQLCGMPSWIGWHLIGYFTTILTVSLISALAAVAIYRVLRRMTGENYFSLLGVITIWLGTLAFPFSTLFFSHQFAAALLAIAFYLLFEIGRDEGRLNRGEFQRVGAAGLLVSLSVASEYPTALLAGLLSIYAIWRIAKTDGQKRTKWILVGAFAAGALAGSGALFLYNLAAFGSAFYIPYESYTTTGAHFAATYSRGWLGLHWPGVGGFLNAFRTIMFSSQIGMLHISAQRWFIYACNPVLWLCLPGFVIMIRKRQWRAEGLLVLAMTLAYVLFITTYGASVYDWCGAVYLGSRHLIPLLPFLALPLCFGARAFRFIFYPLLLLSIFYMLLATAIEPRVPDPYQNTARDFLMPSYLHGLFAQSTSYLFDRASNLTNDSTAFNLAKLVRVPGAYQLAPLMIWWFIAGGALLLRARREDRHPPGASRNSIVALGLFVFAIVLPPIIAHAAANWRHPTHGLLGKYYRNLGWSGAPVETSVDAAINFDWTQSSPLPAPYSVEWTGSIVIDQSGDYTFSLLADDGAALEIDGKTIVDASRVIMQEQSSTLRLEPGAYSIRVRYFNVRWGGLVKLSWSNGGLPEQVVPTQVLIPPDANDSSKHPPTAREQRTEKGEEKK